MSAWSADYYPGQDLPFLIHLQSLAQDSSTFSPSFAGISQNLNQSGQPSPQTPSFDYLSPGQPVGLPPPLPSPCTYNNSLRGSQTGPASLPVPPVQGFRFSTNDPSLAGPNGLNQLQLDQDLAATGPGLAMPNSAATNLSVRGDFFNLGVPTHTQFTIGQQHNHDASLLNPLNPNPPSSSASLPALYQTLQDNIPPNEALYQVLATPQFSSSSYNNNNNNNNNNAALPPPGEAQRQLHPFPAGSFLPPRSRPAPQDCVSASQAADVERDLETQSSQPSFNYVSHPHGHLPQENDGRRLKHEDEEDGDRNAIIGLLVDDNMPAPSSRKRTRASASIDEQAGPSIVKRRRSRSSTAASARSTKAAVRKAVHDARAVVIPDSDDIFGVEDDEEPAKLFDLTRDDKIPEELMGPPKEDNSTKLVDFECIICMDTAMNLTVTHCGHMFCGNCLHQAMHAEGTKKICPMCRQKLEARPKNGQSSKTAKTFFHLELKLRPSKKQGKQPARMPNS